MIVSIRAMFRIFLAYVAVTGLAIFFVEEAFFADHLATSALHHASGSLTGPALSPRHPLMLQTPDCTVSSTFPPLYNIQLPPLKCELNFSSEKLRHDIGIEGIGGNEVLAKVREGVVASRTFLQHATSVRILCMIYTYEQNHHLVQAITSTWGKECDGFFAASNSTDPSIGAIDLKKAGPEMYSNIWQKVRAMWACAGNYAEHFDYFFICGDVSVPLREATIVWFTRLTSTSVTHRMSTPSYPT
jgi:hypothetical protein